MKIQFDFCSGNHPGTRVFDKIFYIEPDFSDNFNDLILSYEDLSGKKIIGSFAYFTRQELYDVIKKLVDEKNK